MKKSCTVVAYPTIPIVFVASVNEKRIPLHDTMGLAVTDLEEKTRSETTLTVQLKEKGIEFFLEGKPVDARRTTDIQRVVNEFMKAAGVEVGLRIESSNYNIFSGSSDSGAAALVVGLNDLFGTKFPKQKLADLGNSISESAIRSVYGGLSMYVVSEGSPHGIQLASETDLKDIKIFAIGFNYETRVSAQEIFEICRASPYWKMRLERVPLWVSEIKKGLAEKNWEKVFSNAEANCANAHYLIESGGKRCRRKEMMTAVIDVEEIRAAGLPCYWTAGGGRVINTFSWVPHADKALEELRKRGQNPILYKVAGGPKIIRSE
jgi:mevalonate-3-kinase